MGLACSGAYVLGLSDQGQEQWRWVSSLSIDGGQVVSGLSSWTSSQWMPSVFMGEPVGHQRSAKRWRLQNVKLERGPKPERRARWRLRNAKLVRSGQRLEACDGDPAGGSPSDTTLQPVRMQEDGMWDEAPLVSDVCDAYTEDMWENNEDVKLEELDSSAKYDHVGESETDDATDSGVSIGSEWDAGSEYSRLSNQFSPAQEARCARSVAKISWADVAKRSATSASNSSDVGRRRTTLAPLAIQTPYCKVSSGPTVSFNGVWAGRGEAKGNTFLWKDGPTVPLRFFGKRVLELTLDGRRHRGVLKGDGKLHWDDGDIWSRETLQGVWAGRGEVKGKMLSWKDGPSTPLRLIGNREIELTLDGRRHHGMLKDDGNLHWEDGDIWTRERLTSGSSGFGFHLHSEVRLVRGCNGVPADELGMIVGFTLECVEVKFLVKILRCLPADLRESAVPAHPAPSAISARSTTGRGSPSDKTTTRQATSAQRERIADAALARSVAVDTGAQGAPWAPARKAAGHQVVEIARREKSGEVATGKFRASDTSVQARAVVAPRNAAGNMSADLESPWYTGVVNWSRGSMAWLQCRALHARFPDQDIFLHRTEMRGGAMPHQWERICFRLMTGSDGKPRAVQARRED